MKAKSYNALLDLLRNRKKSYQAIFGPSGIIGSAAMLDLAQFCRAFETTWSEDARHHARLEGRREVFGRIRAHLHLEPDELAALYRAVVVKQTGDE